MDDARAFNFSSGMPDPATFPSRALAEAAARVLPRAGATLVRYPGAYGDSSLREIAAERMRRNHDLEIPIDHFVLTSGSMQAIGLVAQALARPGLPIITEEFTYSGTLGAFRKYEADLVGVPLDADGMRIDALEATLDRLGREGRPPAFIYTIASHQNPTGTMLSVKRRHQLLELARAHGVLIVEDDCYADVLFEGTAPPAIYRFAEPGEVLYIGSFSKILGPGVRLGYFIAPEPLQGRISRYKIDGGTNGLAAMIVAEFFREHLWEHVRTVCAAVQAKRDAMLAALERHLGGEPEVSWSRPCGGLFLWLRLPDATDTRRLQELARARGVQFAAGRSFDAADRDVKYLRLAFGYEAVEAIPEGVARLAEALREAQVRAPTRVAVAAAGD